MDSVSPVNELEQQLKKAGEHLASPHSSSVNNLINLIDKTKQLLASVGQAPSISMQKALVPAMGALITDELIKHAETDVKISVASCLCEVVRITAPDQTYEDEVMKEIFKLYVLAFKQLSNVTGQSYHKVIHILQSVAKVKSFLLMLDLECDALVFEMFEQFLSKIRIGHPRAVFSDIETIMTLIIEESDEISIELLSLLISHAKKENQIVSPASWKLAEKVLKRCSNTLIKELINSNLDDYAEVVTLICQNGHENEHLGTRSTSRTNSTHKRDLITLDNDRSTKKQKYTDNNRFKTPKRGRPKKNDNPSLGRNSQKGTARTRVLDKRQSSKAKGNTKNSGSDNGAGDKDDIPKKWREDLVGHMIKVWWPLDKVYYEGVVASYDPLNGKHKVLYADGEEELLDLNDEKWRMVGETSVDQVSCLLFLNFSFFCYLFILSFYILLSLSFCY
ncbi:sister chromatid cohesion protein PDS5 homolog D-like [Bidens hawaiensis]|uniref:sister chromatid cohesion protein PDS5 homolog D-like n=1 Tax=Bidens hawaiensis TaxID=980011 RepID=UPI0040497742